MPPQEKLPTKHFNLLTPHQTTCNHAIFTRHGGISPKPFDTLNIRHHIGDSPENISSNRQQITNFFNIAKENLISLNQTHSKNILILNSPNLPTNLPQTTFNEFEDFDAIITNQKGFHLMIQVADCQPIILFDPIKKAIANIHSGWRGTVQNIVGATVDAMIKNFQSNPKDLITCIGPSLGPCCAEFKSRDQEFPSSLHQFFLPEFKVDLWAITKHQLTEKGINLQNIEFSNTCTRCNTQDFFSYRANNEIGRFAVVIGLK